MVTGQRLEVEGFRVQGSRFMVRFNVQGFGSTFRVRFKVQGLNSEPNP